MSLKQKIKEKGLTQQELADMLGVKQTAISNWCNGYNLPSTDKLLKLEKILGCSISELLGYGEGSDEPLRISDLACRTSEAIAADLSRAGYSRAELGACPALNCQLTVQWMIDRNLVDPKKLEDELK